MEGHVGGSINADDAIQEPARHRRTNRISARVEEMRQQIDIAAAGLRIFVDDDEVAIGKGGNGGIGLRSGHPIGTAVYAEVDLLLAERLKSGSHCRPPICVPNGQQVLRNCVWNAGGGEAVRSGTGSRSRRETVRRLQIELGLWRPKRRRAKRVFQLRERRPRFGELIQIDGSPHDWFEGRGAALHADRVH